MKTKEKIITFQFPTHERNLTSHGKPSREFHISRQSRDKYKFDQSLFSLNGNVVFANFHAVRQFVRKMNDKRDLVNFPEQAVRAGQINAMGLIDEILHYVIELYRQEKNPRLNEMALKWLTEKLGKKNVERALQIFVEEFPPLHVYNREQTVEQYLQGKSEGIPNKEVALEEMILLWLANANPAFSPYLELFDDERLEHETEYRQIIHLLDDFFKTQPFFGPENQPLLKMLRTPAIKVPHSLTGQLEYILEKWSPLLGKYLSRLLSSLDLIKEEEKLRFAGGAGPSQVYDFTSAEDEPERFSPDKDWMPNLVLIAKSTFVWLDQLSKKYQRSITRLDEIPDEELDQLARWGFTGLWLIGIWERSSASKKIKQYCGNPEAESSAYSLFDYVVAQNLGGDEAFENLKKRCWQRGIRLASDMVPNHTGIYSRWIIEHPDWFIGQPYSPFPGYSFNGANLSDDPNLGIYIEDHYYDRSDAAVVFKRIDFRTGETRYIYHGNDGTSMPWNDTAQLNYLNPELREAVIKTILHVARQTPIIRFDAAMTLTKKHYQRLWFPEPGTGGDIPSRAEHAMTKEEFNRHMPQEFWREVVDRVAQEAPDTLLLAEAFWLMEGYFVRTLGMHRVYNSAFMNMLKNEENSKYREVIKKTLEFNPEILKRYVNFMNNPDEETAIAQFGKDDKYFGVCTMLVTMPGLPMFGHGQIEGFHEKYGMEYRRAYWDEQPDQDLIRRHEREIFPLMKKRYLFADVKNFLLYDFFAPEGYVNENVFAYSNRSGDERALVVFNNKFERARGWIKTSVAYKVKTESGEHLEQKSLAEGLGLRNDDRCFTIFRDQISGLEFIRSSRQLWNDGLYVELEAFKYQVFLDFREVEDNEWHHYSQLNDYLNGRGVPNIEETLKELYLQPVHLQFEKLIMAENLQRFRDLLIPSKEKEIDNLVQSFNDFISVAAKFVSSENKTKEIVENFRKNLSFAGNLLESILPLLKKKKHQTALKKLIREIQTGEKHWQETLFFWLVLREIGKLIAEEDFSELSRSYLDEWLLSKLMRRALAENKIDENEIERVILLVEILVSNQDWAEKLPKVKPTYHLLKNLFAQAEVQNFLGVNRYEGILWFNKENFDSLMRWLTMAALFEMPSKKTTANKKAETIFYIVEKLQLIAEKSNYQVEKLIEFTKDLK